MWLRAADAIPLGLRHELVLAGMERARRRAGWKRGRATGDRRGMERARRRAGWKRDRATGDRRGMERARRRAGWKRGRATDVGRGMRPVEDAVEVRVAGQRDRAALGLDLVVRPVFTRLCGAANEAGVRREPNGPDHRDDERQGQRDGRPGAAALLALGAPAQVDRSCVGHDDALLAHRRGGAPAR